LVPCYLGLHWLDRWLRLHSLLRSFCQLGMLTRPVTAHLTIASDLTIFHCCAASADRKSTRLNSSHITISYAVFCLKKKNTKKKK